MSNLILEIKDVSHSYDDKETALSNINLEVDQGEKVSILGPSGSGKTTLLRLIAGLERPKSGSINLQGAVVSTKNFILAPEKRNLGLVVQEKALFPHLTVKENITFGIRKEKGKNDTALSPIASPFVPAVLAARGTSARATDCARKRAFGNRVAAWPKLAPDQRFGYI